MEQRFLQRVAVITGGTSGIGLATARALAAEGATVIVAGRDGERGRLAVASITSAGGRAAFFRCDVRSEDEVRTLFERTAERYGGVDYLCNAAGAEGTLAPIAEYPADRAREIVETDLLGTFHATKHALPHLGARPGAAVVNVASFLGTVVPIPINAIYAASKAAVVAFTAATAAGFPDGAVRAFAVCPWVTDTPMLERLTGASDDMRAAYGGMNPGGALAEAADIATAVVDLLAGGVALASGSAVLVDRGGATTPLEQAS
jgi:NAD(P)-dependent dehydrogenase (short-subunit alcohol dehydrogenase family)